MSPSIKITTLPITVFVGDGTQSLTVDPDVGVLYIAADSQISILFYSSEAVKVNGGFKH